MNVPLPDATDARVPAPNATQKTTPKSVAPNRSALPRYLATHLQGRDAQGLQNRIDDFRDTIRQSGGRIVDIKWDDRPWADNRRAIVFYEVEPLRRW